MPVTDVTQEINRMLDMVSMSKAKLDIIQRHSSVVDSGQTIKAMTESLDKDLYEIERLARRNGADTQEILRSLENLQNSSSGLNQRIQNISNVLDGASDVVSSFMDSPQVETAKSSAVTALSIQEINQNLTAMQAQQLMLELEKKKAEIHLNSRLRKETQDTYSKASNSRESSFQTFKSILSTEGAKSYREVATKEKEADQSSAYIWGPL